jgi:hypothetical protein
LEKNFVKQDKSGEKKEKETFPAPMQIMGVETQNGSPHRLVLHWRGGVEGIYVLKDNGSG